MRQPPTLSESRIEGGAMFAKLMFFAACSGVAVHSIYSLVFYWHGWSALAMLSGASTLLYLGIIAGLRDPNRGRLMAVLAFVEIAAHAVVAVLSLGWDSGFHLYVLALSPIVFLGAGGRPLVKWLSVAALAAGYVALRYATHRFAPWYVVPPQALNLFEYVNIVGMVFLLSLGASVHYRAVVTGERALMDLASIDPLTGLANRRHWLDAAALAQRRLRNEGLSFSVLVGDVDHFKAINDRHGHGGGDQALHAISRALQQGVRGIDTVGRWGGEEFAVLLTGASLNDAHRVAEQLRKRILKIDLRLDEQPVSLTMTLGAAQAELGESVQAVLQRADGAMYRGKVAGRNRVEIAAPANASASLA